LCAGRGAGYDLSKARAAPGALGTRPQLKRNFVSQPGCSLLANSNGAR